MMENSTFSKMQQHYWEAKQKFLKKVKRQEDDFVVSSDAELDAKLELLKSIDETNQNLLNTLDLYQERICVLAQEKCLLGRFLRECSKHDTTKADNLLSASGKTFLFMSHQLIMLRNVLGRAYRNIETFQYRAVADTFDTVEQMEKARTAYRAGLLWMKDISKQLDPDVCNQVDKFKKVQDHVRKTKVSFDKLKLDTIQKIDLLSASRCNLFSNSLTFYQNTLLDIWDKSTKTMDIFSDTFKTHLDYEFTMLKELNSETNNNSIQNFEAKLKQILLENNVNEKDMLIFFESEYKDEKRDDPDNSKIIDSKLENSASSRIKNSKNKLSKKDSINLLDFGLLDDDNQNDINLNKIHSYLPSNLIDFDQKKTEELIDQNTKTFNFSKIETAKNQNEKKTNSWLDLFADIDPLSNPEEFDRHFMENKSYQDRNC